MDSSATPTAASGKASGAGRMPLTVFLLLVGINLLWAGSSLAAKIALQTIPPMTLAFTRFALAALMMYGVARVRGVDLRVARRDWGMFWAMGILGLALTYLLAYQGIQRTTASDSALIHATEPVFLSVLAYFFLRERMFAVKVLGIIAGLLGTYLIVANGWRLPALSGAVAGDLLITLGLTFEAGSSIVGKNLVSRYPPASVMTYQMLSGAIALAPFAMWELAQPGHAPHPTAAALWSLLYLVVPCTVFAYTVWFTILETRGAGEMSVFLFIQPVSGALLGAWLLHEPVTVWTIAGAVLVLSGVALINRRPPLPKAPPPNSPAA